MEQVATLHKTLHTPGRNDPCPCGSGKKYKRCHGPAVKKLYENTPGPILPDHPLWMTFLRLMDKAFLEQKGRNKVAGLNTVRSLRALGLSDVDVLKNIEVFTRYGGYSELEIFYNVQRNFTGTIDRKKRKTIIRVYRMGLGDDVIITGVIREIKKVCPSCEIDIITRNKNLFLFNPNITKLDINANDVELCELGLSSVPADYHDRAFDSSFNAKHYSFKLHLFAQMKLNLQWDCKNIKPDLHLGNTLNPVRNKLGFGGAYWLINSGFYGVMPYKWYPQYQKVVDLLRGKVQFIQHGGNGPNDVHTPLDGALSIVGQTSPLELAAAFRDCAGSLGGASSHAHFAAAFDRPCVIVAGGAEPPEWTNYENQTAIFKNIGCSNYKAGTCGYPRNDLGRNGEECCPHFLGNHAECFDAISPEEVADAILKYQGGGI